MYPEILFPLIRIKSKFKIKKIKKSSKYLKLRGLTNGGKGSKNYKDKCLVKDFKTILYALTPFITFHPFSIGPLKYQPLMTLPFAKI